MLIIISSIELIELIIYRIDKIDRMPDSLSYPLTFILHQVTIKNPILNY